MDPADIHKLVRRIPEPSVPRKGLVIGAGLFWVIGGAILLTKAVGIFAEVEISLIWPILAGLIVGFAKSQFVFSRLVKKNVKRIQDLSPHKDKICLFAFQPMQSYLMVILMIGLGFLLRLIPMAPMILVAIYFAIGTALVLSSFSYFRLSRTC